jgi:hypothetical protein
MVTMPAIIPQLTQLDRNILLGHEILSRLTLEVILGIYYTSLVRWAGFAGAVQCLVNEKTELVEAGDDDDDEEEEYEEEEEEEEGDEGEGEEEEEEEEGRGDEPPAKRQKRDDDDKKKEEEEGEEEEEEVPSQLTPF